jgi:hypothetical protein
MQEPEERAMREAASHVLATHPEGVSLLSEAGHRRALAQQSATVVTRTFNVMQAARVGYEELRHRLDPRGTRTIHCALGLGLLAVILAALTMLDAIEFTGVLAGWMAAAAAVAAAAAWLGCAWLAALAHLEERHGPLTAIAAGVVLIGALLAALHAEGTGTGRTGQWYRFGVSALVALLVLALVAAAAMLITRTEPAPLLVARRRWHRHRADHAAAVRMQRADAEADAIAGQGWRGLVQAHAGVRPHTGVQARNGVQVHTAGSPDGGNPMGVAP